MEHVNPKIAQMPGLFGAIERFLPELYQAESLEDFIREQKNLKATRCTFWRCMPLALYHGTPFFFGQSLIKFSKLDIHPHNGHYALQDTWGSREMVIIPRSYLTPSWAGPWSRLFLGRDIQGRYVDPVIHHQLDTGRSWLLYARRE